VELVHQSFRGISVAQCGRSGNTVDANWQGNVFDGLCPDTVYLGGLASSTECSVMVNDIVGIEAAFEIPCLMLLIPQPADRLRNS
jgi:hypothetical protein